jgi:hypothetical protein
LQLIKFYIQMSKPIIYFFLLMSVLSCTFRFNAYDISSEVKTFSVAQFETTAGNAPPTIGQQFSEQLKQRILNDTRLQYRDSKGDIEFSGAVTSYQISPIAPQPGQTVALQRLTLRMDIECKSEKQEIKSWSPSFTRFADFAADADLSEVENRLVKEIYDQIIEDVFNRAFSNW